MGPTRSSADRVRLDRAQLAFDGVSVAEAFTSQPDAATACDKRDLCAAPWRHGAGAATALEALQMLHRQGEVSPDELAERIARRYLHDPHRHYGDGTARVLDAVSRGLSPSVVARSVADGGSLGTGATSRALVVGAWFADELDRAIEQAGAAATITHAHPEGRAGAVAVAVAAAASAMFRSESARATGPRVLELVAAHTPDSEVREAMHHACALRLDRPIGVAAQVLLAEGARRSAQVVPFAIWCAARHLDGFAEAMWSVGRVGSHRIGRLVGGIVALRAGVPDEWLARRERLEAVIVAPSLLSGGTRA